MKRACTLVDGILLLDKPAGITSNRALQEVKRAWGACKAGHTGSLDPLATGLLPLCFGEATKISGFMLTADKSYWAQIRLGVVTTTYDAEGDVVRTRPVTITHTQLQAAIAALVGDLEQVPPMYSALKQHGQPLYKRARAGITVERMPRRIRIYRAELLAVRGDIVEVMLHCSKGTYIRSWAYDLGESLGCGAHITALRRTGLGRFGIERAISLAEATLRPPTEILLGVDEALSDLPSLALPAAAARKLQQGQAVYVGSDATAAYAIRLYDESRVFLGIGQADGGWIRPKRLCAVDAAGKSVEAVGSGG